MEDNNTMPANDMLFNHFLLESISYKYCEGSAKVEVPPHNTGWRSMPFTVIICSFDNDYICELEDGTIYTINNGQSIVIPSDIRHKMVLTKQNRISFVHIQFTILDSVDILSLFNVPIIFGEEFCSTIGQSIDQLSMNYFDDSEFFPIKKMLEQRDAAFKLLYTITSNSTINEDTPKLLPKLYKLYPVLSYLHKNTACIENRKELADIISLSETRFHYFFKDITGQSPISYLISIRLKKAQLLLLTTDLTIDAISKQVGYDDVFNFSKQFKKKFAISPSAYRKEHKLYLGS